MALVGSGLLPLHAGGVLGGAIAVSFVCASMAMAVVTFYLGAAASLPHRHRQLRSWSLLGAVGFLISGIALVADLLSLPMVFSEVMAVLAVGAWWSSLGGSLLARGPEELLHDAGVGRRGLAVGSLVAAAAAVVAVGVQLLGDASPGAVPVRLAYLAWGPWGLLAAAWLTGRRAEG